MNVEEGINVFLGVQERKESIKYWKKETWCWLQSHCTTYVVSIILYM